MKESFVGVERRKSAAASPTKRMKRILMAESEQAVNKKAFTIDTVVGGCSTANHRHEHQQRLGMNLIVQLGE